MNVDHQILQAQRELYRGNFLKHGDTPRGTFQNNRVTMHLRYERLVAGFDLSDRPSVLDVGCGLADLHAYLKKRGVAHRYHGSEIVPEMVEACRLKYPDIEVDGRTIFEFPARSFDWVVLSGALNLRGGVELGRWHRYAMSLVEQMYAVCRLGMSFNFLTTYNTFQDPELGYFDPGVVLNRMLGLSRFVSVDHAYPLYECSVRVATEECLKRQFPAPELDRYLNRKEIYEGDHSPG